MKKIIILVFSLFLGTTTIFFLTGNNDYQNKKKKEKKKVLLENKKHFSFSLLSILIIVLIIILVGITIFIVSRFFQKKDNQDETNNKNDQKQEDFKPQFINKDILKYEQSDLYKDFICMIFIENNLVKLRLIQSFDKKNMFETFFSLDVQNEKDDFFNEIKNSKQEIQDFFSYCLDFLTIINSKLFWKMAKTKKHVDKKNRELYFTMKSFFDSFGKQKKEKNNQEDEQKNELELYSQAFKGGTHKVNENMEAWKMTQSKQSLSLFKKSIEDERIFYFDNGTPLFPNFINFYLLVSALRKQIKEFLFDFPEENKEILTKIEDNEKKMNDFFNQKQQEK